MSKIQWESELVEKPFCQQLKVMGWQWLEGDTDVPELTERANFREVMLKGRLRATNSSAPFTKQFIGFRKGKRETVERIATSVAASCGTRKVRARVSAWFSSSAKCGRWNG